MKTKSTRCFLLAIVLLVSMVSSAAAQTKSFNATITPQVQYLRIKPGSKVKHTITIENNGETPLTVSPKILDFTADGTTGRPILLGQTEFPYLDFDPEKTNAISIPAKKRAQLTLQFNVPEDAQEKEYPLTVLFESTPSSSNALTSQSQLVGAIGSNLIVLISHEEQTSQLLNINSISTPFFVDSFKKVVLEPTIKNNHFAATNAAGSVVITDMFGNQVADFDIFPDTILGYSSRNLRALRTPFQQDVEPEAVPFAFKPSFFFGLYTVEITLTQPYTSENAAEVIAFDTFSFFALPILPTIFLVLVAIFAIANYSYQNWYLNR